MLALSAAILRLAAHRSMMGIKTVAWLAPANRV